MWSHWIFTEMVRQIKEHEYHGGWKNLYLVIWHHLYVWVYINPIQLPFWKHQRFIVLSRKSQQNKKFVYGTFRRRQKRLGKTTESEVTRIRISAAVVKLRLSQSLLARYSGWILNVVECHSFFDPCGFLIMMRSKCEARNIRWTRSKISAARDDMKGPGDYKKL